MRDTLRPFGGWSYAEIERHVTENLGAQELWNRLRNKHEIPGPALVKMVGDLKDSDEVMEFMGGRSAVAALPPVFREPMIANATVRYLLEQFEEGYGRKSGVELDNPSRGQYLREADPPTEVDEDYRKGMGWAYE